MYSIAPSQKIRVHLLFQIDNPKSLNQHKTQLIEEKETNRFLALTRQPCNIIQTFS